MDRTLIPDDISAAISALDEALAPLIPDVAQHLHDEFPQTDPEERLAAMLERFAIDWPLLQYHVPLFAEVDYPAMATRQEGESVEHAAQRCFAILCFVTAIAAAFLPDEATQGLAMTAHA